MGCVLAYIDDRSVQVVVYIISLDVGRLYVAYPYLGAMREPDCRDRRGEKLYSHVFFYACNRDSSIVKMLVMTASRGALAGGYVCD